MHLPIDATLDVILRHTSAPTAWAEIVELCRTCSPDAPWDSLPKPDLERDIAAAHHWLESQLNTVPEAVGIYLGLDTLNMNEGAGKNVEFGGTSDCDPANESVDWLGGELDYGSDHLIYGLYELQRMYETDAWKQAFSLCDYIFFLGYSGIVLTQAFERLSTNRTLMPIWGFHDGDMFTLGRKRDGQFTRFISCE